MKSTQQNSSRAKRLASRLHFPKLLNARDLGGYAIRGGAHTRMRSVLRTDDLWRLTPEGARALLDYGVCSVIDLRWPLERKSRPSVFERGEHGVHYTHLSLLDGSEAAWIARTPDVPKERWNCVVLDHAKVEMAQVLNAVADAPPGVVLFHCAAGKDRTGIVAAMVLAVANVEPHEIADDYSISTDYIRDAFLAARRPEDREAVLEDVRCPPEQIYNMLAHLEDRYGGTVGYLRHIGLDQGTIDRLRRRLVPEA